MRLAAILTIQLLFVYACPASAAKTGIHAMVLGNRLLQVGETRQLTSASDGAIGAAVISPDGKHVACVTTTEDRLLLVSSGKRAVKVLASAPDLSGLAPQQRPNAQPGLRAFSLYIAWAPNSKVFAAIAYVGSDTDDADGQAQSIQIWTLDGICRTQIAVPKGWWLNTYMVFSPDSRQLAVAMAASAKSSDGKPQRSRDIIICDTVTGATRSVATSSDRMLEPKWWSDGGAAIVYRATGKGASELRKAWLDGTAESVVATEEQGGIDSPDRSLRLLGAGSETTVLDVTTRDCIRTFKTDPNGLIGWLPNSHMFALWRYVDIQDCSKERKRTLRTLWIANPDAAKLNTMCVALDTSSYVDPTWSADCRNVAYVQGNCLQLTELKLTEPDIAAKLDAGLPLTEEEEMGLIMVNGKEIGLAICMYASDFDHELPDETGVTDTLHDYLRDKDAFYRPGTQDPIFTYHRPAGQFGNVDDPSETVIGELDPGPYAWKVLIYLDGHTRAELK